MVLTAMTREDAAPRAGLVSTGFVVPCHDGALAPMDLGECLGSLKMSDLR